MADLQRARERLVLGLGREEERRRLRGDLHDDLAPVLAAQALRADAAGELELPYIGGDVPDYPTWVHALESWLAELLRVAKPDWGTTLWIAARLGRIAWAADRDRAAVERTRARVARERNSSRSHFANETRNEMRPAAEHNEARR
jgi:hypothetical protein